MSKTRGCEFHLRQGKQRSVMVLRKEEKTLSLLPTDSKVKNNMKHGSEDLSSNPDCAFEQFLSLSVLFCETEILLSCLPYRAFVGPNYVKVL